MSLNRPYIEKIQKLRNDMAERKHADYASVVDPIAINGIPGLITRITDKAVRLASINKNGKVQVNESMIETANDLANYADYLVVMAQGQWPGVGKAAAPAAAPAAPVHRRGRRRKEAPAVAPVAPVIK